MNEIGLLTWYIVQLVLWAGPFWLTLLLAAWSAFCFCVGHLLEAKFNVWGDFLDILQAKPDKPMKAQKLDHIKYDILPNGTLGPGDPRGLEDPE